MPLLTSTEPILTPKCGSPTKYPNEKSNAKKRKKEKKKSINEPNRTMNDPILCEGHEKRQPKVDL
jgi:hypothetical protein